MPKGPKGQERPADVVWSAVHVMRIATGAIEEALTDDGQSKAVELGRKGGLARARSISRKRWVDTVKVAAAARHR